MKKMFALILIPLLVAGCKSSEDTPAPEEVVISGPAYAAEYGIPDQALISACSGDKSLVRPVTKCVRRANNATVNVSLCYSLEPIFMTIPSPSGQRQVPIPGGVRYDTCAEGSTVVDASTLVCNLGYRLLNDTCISYEASGSYVSQLPQTYQKKGGLKLHYTLGSDFRMGPLKPDSQLKMILVFE